MYMWGCVMTVTSAFLSISPTPIAREKKYELTQWSTSSFIYISALRSFILRLRPFVIDHRMGSGPSDITVTPALVGGMNTRRLSTRSERCTRHAAPPWIRPPDFIMNWGRAANAMGQPNPPPSPAPHHHRHHPPPGARILLNHGDVHSACLSLCFGLSVREGASSPALLPP